VALPAQWTVPSDSGLFAVCGVRELCTFTLKFERNELYREVVTMQVCKLPIVI